MQERIFTLKKGTEVPAVFDGVTIPFLLPMSLAEIARVHGMSEAKVSAIAGIEATLDSLDLAARNNITAVHNQAHALNVQKSVKADASEVDDKNVLVATVDSLREAAATFKYGQVRVRGAASGSAKPSAAKVEQALGADFLAMLTPEQKALYDERIAALKVKPAAPAAPVATETPAPAPAPTPEPEVKKGKGK